MRLSISNIAWDASEDDQIARLLADHGLDAIDLAPGKYFPDPTSVKDAEIAAVKAWWAAKGIQIIGMQALLFGTTGLNLFGPEEVRSKMMEHLSAVCRIGGALGVRALVFGSPKNRDRHTLSDEQVDDIAVAFFRKLGEVARVNGVVICLEPNPIRYGANFMTNSEETARMVELVAHPSIRMQFDTGALALNGESPESALDRCIPFIGHIHASEPDLIPLGDGPTDHLAIHALLRERLPEHVVTIEMVATKDEPHLVSVDRAIRHAIASYCGPSRSVS